MPTWCQEGLDIDMMSIDDIYIVHFMHHVCCIGIGRHAFVIQDVGKRQGQPRGLN